ncbi:hypothetical protein [Tichowtungia aerotolerans]|uniref:Uncharacterized protein n=1 Tax=Tichowtungia aerotolerans TaxID=2697043 RepID=A0A6P1MBL4_9BACT|nr:hypothetical protein [Tichowtungia aerotolerans]QHI69934.1 hypothetical protein GT409_10885 [Tichowtungia aerotolerans]
MGRRYGCWNHSNLITPWTEEVWSRFWWWAAVVLPLGTGVVTTIWFTGGVLKHLRRFFSALTAERVDDSDDGAVRLVGPA